jgi:hypothetical protein
LLHGEPDLPRDRRRNRLPVLLETLEVGGHRLTHVGYRLFPGTALGEAAWKRRDLGDEHAVFVLLNVNAVAYPKLRVPLRRLGLLCQSRSHAHDRDPDELPG